MANIRVDVDHTISDGAEVLFYAPCDFADISGLKVYYPGPDAGIMSHEFTFQDAHKNDLSNLDNLFAEGACVKVILSVTNSVAHIQNADTNAYLEEKFDEKVNKTDIDQTLDANSTNPIANKAVAEEFGKYLPKSGGTIDGSLESKVAEGKGVQHVIDNTVRRICNEIYASGQYHFYDSTNKKEIITSTLNGTNTFNGTASGNIKYTDKPTGTYTGNGDATSRIINTGGIGKVLYVSRSSYSGIVFEAGGLLVKNDGTITGLTCNQAHFTNGKLVLATDGILNESGIEITYNVV